jgi:hypothetical protein
MRGQPRIIVGFFDQVKPESARAWIVFTCGGNHVRAINR